MADLDDRLAAYARHLDEHIERFEVPTDRPVEVRSLVDVRSEAPRRPDPRSSSQRVWLASAAAVVLLLAGSLAWWRSSGDRTDTTDTTTVDEPAVRDSVVDGAADPVRWQETDHPAGFSAPRAAVPFEGGLVAVSGDGVFKPLSWWSPDGEHWQDQVEMSETGTVHALATDGSVAVAVGLGTTSGRSWVTEDGATWEAHDIADASDVSAVATTPLGFVAVGSSLVRADGTPARDHLAGDGSAEPDAVPAAWRSSDGATWERLAIPDDLTGALVGVASSADAVVLVGSSVGNPYITTSVGGGDWRPVEVTDAEHRTLLRLPTAVTWTGDRFLAVGGSLSIPLLWESPDGLGFTQVPTGALGGRPDLIQGVLQVAAVDGTVVVLAGFGPGDHTTEPWLWASTDRGEWMPAAPIDGFPVPMAGVTAVEGRFVAVATDGGIWVGTPTR